MTWLSRLLPPGRGIQQLVDHNDIRRDRRVRRRRRMSTVEPLEGRIVLSNITVTQDPNTSAVSIVGDTHGDQFKVVVLNGAQLNQIEVVGLDGKTQVNGHNPGVPYISPVAAEGLTMTLPGNSAVKDVVELLGNGVATPSELKFVTVNVTGTSPNLVPLTFSANGIRAATGPGSFTLTDGTATTAGGQLTASVTNSQFSTLSIFQTGCCHAAVTLTNDVVPGAVSVTEGVANGDTINISGPDSRGVPTNSFGPTTLTQGAGPQMAGCYGNSDVVTVDDMNLTNLTINQITGVNPDGKGPNGNNDQIYVGTGTSEVEVSSASFGIVANQGDGASDVMTLISITTNGKPLNNPHSGPDSIALTQGNGNFDTITVDDATVFGNITSVQGNGANDTVNYQGDVAGYFTVAGGFITDFFGLGSISQGNGGGDVANLTCSVLQNPGRPNQFNNVNITQGTGSVNLDACTNGTQDTINVNCTTVESDMNLVQGFGDTTGADLGNNVINIATNTAHGMTVFVGDSTSILENGPNNGNNSITFGVSGDKQVDFTTGFLDVYTGAAGGAFVQVYNTQVLYGALGLFGPFNINGDGDGNTAIIDAFSSLSVTSAF